MTSRTRRSASPNERATPIARVMRSIVHHHSGHATPDQIVSNLGDMSPDLVNRTLASLVDVGYLEVNGTRRGWTNRTHPIHRVTDKGKAALPHLMPHLTEHDRRNR